MNLSDGDWIAVQVHCGREQDVGGGLEIRGYEQFVPTRGWAPPYSRRSRVQCLFPGYVFCRYLHHAPHRIVSVPGVIRLVGVHGAPLSIPSVEIDSIRTLVNSGICTEPWRFLSAGEEVIVVRGSLCGARGILVRTANGGRLVVSITMLRRSVGVEVAARDVMPANRLL